MTPASAWSLRPTVRRLFQRHGADPASAQATSRAAERFFSGLQRRYRPLVGQDGYRALLQEAHRRATRLHPVLERYPVISTGGALLGVQGDGIDGGNPGEVWEGLTALTEEFLRLAGAMPRVGEEGASFRAQGARARRSRDRRPAPIATPESDLFPVREKSEPSIEASVESTDPHLDPGWTPDDRPRHEPWPLLVMDRDRATCEAITHVLDASKDFRVVGQALHAAEVKEKAAWRPVDFVVASARLAGDEVIEVCRWCRGDPSRERPQVVVTGLPADPAIQLRYLEAGAAAFTLEEFSVEGLRLTLRLLAREEAVFPLHLQQRMAFRLAELAGLVRTGGLEPDTLWSLTAREGEVLLLLEERLTNKEIARRLYISEGTVKSHVHQILKKLRVRDRAEAARLLRFHRTARGELVLGRTGFKREVPPAESKQEVSKAARAVGAREPAMRY